MRLQAFPYRVQNFLKICPWQRSILWFDNGFKLVWTSATNLQTHNSKHAPDAHDIFDNKNIPSSSFKNADRKKCCVSWQHFLSFSEKNKISAAIKSCLHGHVEMSSTFWKTHSRKHRRGHSFCYCNGLSTLVQDVYALFLSPHDVAKRWRGNSGTVLLFWITLS